MYFEISDLNPAAGITKTIRPSRRVTCTGRSNVKSGCRTCKIRKLKCDEARPACDRCVSTGRVCDGYGIWGGGGGPHHSRHRVLAVSDNKTIPQSGPLLSATTEEARSFEWFKCRTSGKIPGTYISSFWNTLIFQASFAEPAVLHAVLALGSVHQRGILNIDRQFEEQTVPKRQEKFVLQQYVKALSHLQSHLTIKDKSSSRITLITCVVFVSLELLRGHFHTAQVHLQSGLRILEEVQIASRKGESLHLKPRLESTDSWIVQSLSRLHLQVALLYQGRQRPYLFLHIEALEFGSFNDAWDHMQQILNSIVWLGHQSRERDVSEENNSRLKFDLSKQQQDIHAGLEQWLQTYAILSKATHGQRSVGGKKRDMVLRSYHTMANIMASTCLSQGDDFIFDSHRKGFVLLIEQLTCLWELSQIPDMSEPFTDMSKSVVDVGWIPPLYYTAVNCRAHRIRLHAVRFLESNSHREGFWDAVTTARVARKVMELEEQDFYKDFKAANDFSLTSSPNAEDMALPILPGSHRMHDVEIVFSGAPMDKVSLFCKEPKGDLDCRILKAEYRVDLQRWVDIL